MKSSALTSNLLPFFVLALLAAAFMPALWGGYVFDDFGNIVENEALRVTEPTFVALRDAAFSVLDGYPRPLSMLSFALNHAATGLDPFWMKATNLAFHLINGGLLFVFLLALVSIVGPQGAARGPGRWACLAIAAAWIVHPLHVSTVMYVVQRMELLAATCVLLSLNFYLSGRKRLAEGRGSGWLGLVAAAAISLVGVGFKETSLLAPFFALAIEATLFKFQCARSRDTRLLKAAFALLVVAAITLFFWRILPSATEPAAYAYRDFTLYERLLSQGRVLCRYIGWVLLPLPDHLQFYYDDYAASTGWLAPSTTLWGWIGVLLTLAAAWVSRRRMPLVTFGIAWFYVAHLQTSNVVPLELVFEHRNYLALFGVLLAAGTVALHAGRRVVTVPLLRFVAIACVFALASLTLLRSLAWGQPLLLAVTLEANNTKSPRAAYDMGVTLLRISNSDPESMHYSMAMQQFERAASIPRASILPEQALIFSASVAGQPIKEQWWLSMQQKLRTRPLGPSETTALNTLLQCNLSKQCKLPEARLLESYSAALEHGSHSPQLLQQYGQFALMQMRDAGLAEQMYREAYEVSGRRPEFAIRLAEMLSLVGKSEEASRLLAQVHAGDRMGVFDKAAASIRARIDGTGQNPRKIEPSPPANNSTAR